MAITHVSGAEFRREAVRPAQLIGLSRERVAAALGIGSSTLVKWIAVDRYVAVRLCQLGDSTRRNTRQRLTD